MARLILIGALTLAIPRQVHAGASDYVVKALDVLNVTVWNQKTLSGKFTVEPDGTFAFPLVGRVDAGGRAVRDVEATLGKLLSDGYVKNPQISIEVEQARTGMVSVLGEVRQAGTYPLAEGMTLLDMLARAGSMTERASAAVMITRSPADPDRPPSAGGEGTPAPQTIRVSINSLQKGVASANIILRDGDRVFVPRAEEIYVTGQVRTPGSFALRDQMTVLQALALAGGVAERGSSGRIQIVRQGMNGKGQGKAALTDVLQPGDTVVVGERRF